MTTGETQQDTAHIEAGELAGRRALITGAAGGIGRACARALEQGGAKLHLVDSDAAVLTAADELGGQGHIVDLAEEAAIRTLPDDVDILVNCAGLQHVAPLEEFPPERFHYLQQVMVTAPFLLSRHCVPHMYRRGWGRLVHVSSVHGLRASPYKAGYVAAKHGLEGLSKVAALEGAEHGVTSNCVNPGYVDTPLVRQQLSSQAATRGIAEQDVLDEVFLRNTGINRLITPEEVAALVRWLCHDEAAYLTGAALPMDGGWTAR